MDVMWYERNVIWTECDMNGMWYERNVIWTECDMNGMWYNCQLMICTQQLLEPADIYLYSDLNYWTKGEQYVYL